MFDSVECWNMFKCRLSWLLQAATSKVLPLSYRVMFDKVLEVIHSGSLIRIEKDAGLMMIVDFYRCNLISPSPISPNQKGLTILPIKKILVWKIIATHIERATII